MAIHKVDLRLSRELKRFGAFDADACFNCGNCTAVCQHSEDAAQFPRRLIRYGQLGMVDRLISSKESWLCWNCRDCSDTCPRQARPSEYLEAVRRYTIARMDPTGISRLMYTSTAFLFGFALVLAALFVSLLLTNAETPAAGRLDLFGFIPFELIHNLGVAAIVVMGLVAVTSTVRLVRHISTAFSAEPPAGFAGRSGNTAGRVVGAVRDVLDEMVGQARFRTCEIDDDKPAYLRPWFVHYCIMWGFIGLGVATAADFLFKTPGTLVPLWYPSRLLGTVAGLALMYGTSITVVRKLRTNVGTESGIAGTVADLALLVGATNARGEAETGDRTQSRMLPSDWLFLGLLFMVGFTGFVLEVAVYVPILAGIGYSFFLAHIVLAMELLVLFPFTKFAHALYRPLAYGIYRYRTAANRDVEEPQMAAS